MYKTQRGITFLGMLILVAFLGIFVFGIIRLVPVYLEYMNINKAMENVKDELRGGATGEGIRHGLERRLLVFDVTSVQAKDFEITHDDKGWTVHIVYDAGAPFLGNVSLVAHFDKTVLMGAPSGT